ncbi:MULTISPECIES: CPBP family intramembrane glutamic endopeptidase [Haloferax]|uniref:CPBP family intramembrane metalloprotease n=2 Tax=Haloferax TaxID=2251 RepID=A0A6G1Z6R8_9EURY|nr:MULTISPECIES: type II CAAX endopeptidase family protein [Haloferax]KAB1185069.1 CPBP family intramembrane metalloprotease [Haloferax sp. CBA1149]MRW82246.1 CPBP family intramembrane metalloprotease [Haloferax marinisediminis]
MAPVSDWIQRHRIAAFFLLTYAISWGIEGAVKLAGMEPSWTTWFFEGFLSPLSPGVAAAIVLTVSGESVREWLRDILKFRVHPKWYVLAIAIPFVITYASGIASWALGGPVDWSSFEFDPISIVIGIVLGTLLGGGQEELGWRGFAQPELQERYGAFRAAVVIGVLWGGWHLPQFVFPGGMRADWPLALTASYFVGIVAFSILLAWIYNGSGGSAFLAMLMHGTDNSTQGRVPLDLDIALTGNVINWDSLVSMYVSHALITWAIVAIVVAVVGIQLSAGRSGINSAAGQVED